MNLIAHSKNQTTPIPQLQPLAFNMFNGRGLSYHDENHIPFFSTLSEQAIEDIVKKCKTINYHRRWTVEPECNQDNMIYVIFSGKVTLYNGDANKTFVVHDSDTCLREIAVLFGQLRSSAIITLERSTFTTIKKFDFVNWLMTYPEVTLSYRHRLP